MKVFYLLIILSVLVNSCGKADNSLQPIDGNYKFNGLICIDADDFGDLSNASEVFILSSPPINLNIKNNEFTISAPNAGCSTGNQVQGKFAYSSRTDNSGSITYYETVSNACNYSITKCDSYGDIVDPALILGSCVPALGTETLELNFSSSKAAGNEFFFGDGKLDIELPLAFPCTTNVCRRCIYYFDKTN